MTKEEFIKELKKININISCDILIKLDKYYHLLITENEKYNLTNITEETSVYLKHFYDSLTITKAINLDNQKILDVGSGAGFPGLVLKICFPNLKVTLVDALEKRIKFLNLVIEKLDLKDINAIHSRAEDYARNFKEEYDLVTCRAVAKLNILNELCLPMVKINGYFIPMKANISDEIEEAKSSLNKLNSKIDDIIEFKLPVEGSIRNLIKIKKIGKINSIYPRKFDKIKRNPL